MGSTYGRTVLGTTGRPLQVLANLDRADYPAGGITLDWATVSAVASTDETYADGTVVAVGKKGIPLGTVLCAKQVAEVQSITIDATGGTFTATGNGATTAALAYNASAATVQAALRALGGVLADVTVAKVRNRYTLTESPGSDAGTFGLRVMVGGVSRITDSVAYNVSATDLQTALRALDIVGSSGVSVSGSAGGPYTLTFSATLGDVSVSVVNNLVLDSPVYEGDITVALLEAPVYLLTYTAERGNVAAVTTDPASLTGGAGTATVATVTAGTSTLTYGPYDSAATDGRQTLTRGRCYILNESLLEVDPSGGETNHPAVIDGGTVWKARLRVGQPNSTPLGSGNTPSWAAFEAAFPRIRYAAE